MGFEIVAAFSWGMFLIGGENNFLTHFNGDYKLVGGVRLLGLLGLLGELGVFCNFSPPIVAGVRGGKLKSIKF